MAFFYYYGKPIYIDKNPILKLAKATNSKIYDK